MWIACAHCDEPFNLQAGPTTWNNRHCSRKCRVAARRAWSPPAPNCKPPRGARWLPLSNGLFALVSVQDYRRLRQSPWSVAPTGYVADGKGHYLHRVVLAARRGQIVDHVNHDRLDNRRANLRLVSASQNGLNRRGPPKNNTSGILGVSFDRRRDSWRASLRGKTLGRFRTRREAASVRRTATQRLFKEPLP